ncbi:MAG: hypothetical protein PUB94_01295 [Oscillospiraceae bacterium]|nr:hypothetical protein [Oscillospiraceae bacterium]
MSKKSDKDGMAYNPTPSCDPVFGQPGSCYQMINKYGTYNIQPTCDTSNSYPAISHGLSAEEAENVRRERNEWKSDCLKRSKGKNEKG